jgi:hypothetical protein
LLNSEHLSEPWILFEAGALSKTKGSHLCTFLLDVAPADVEPPLGQFQHTLFSREELLKLVQTINKAVETAGERALTNENLIAVFETFWPSLERDLGQIKQKKEPTAVQRSERQLLEEILEILRAQDQRLGEKAQHDLGTIERYLIPSIWDRSSPGKDLYMRELLRHYIQERLEPVLSADPAKKQDHPTTEKPDNGSPAGTT